MFATENFLVSRWSGVVRATPALRRTGVGMPGDVRCTGVVRMISAGDPRARTTERARKGPR
ncbi:hypothetical protein SGUI_0978 [Serinicoccus hydrothermalis]|uniref:Uncharacterized protein n=1 Tax=Serinicoccus hydrothermalis TaxID=1758689 RepID=A0A1B1NAF2_9MICO|nr:hypothetical protein SGUI_0978 [Serinicoccus hydrothermalis]